jgi:hypothetical protein
MKIWKIKTWMQISLAVIAIWLAAYKVMQYIAIKRYEKDMQKRTYSACVTHDEKGTSPYTIHTFYTESDFEGFPQDQETGVYLPIKDSYGKIVKEPPAFHVGEIKSMHIAFVRGYSWSDGYGVSGCLPCYDPPQDRYEIDADRVVRDKVCNDRSNYITQETIPDDINYAKDPGIHVNEHTNAY